MEDDIMMMYPWLKVMVYAQVVELPLGQAQTSEEK